MLLCSLLALFLISYLASAQPAEPSTKETGGPLLLPSGSPETSLDAGNLGSTIGGASGAAAALIVIVLAFAMFRRSRRQNCLYHNKELEEVVPSLPYRKRNVDIETASINTFEFDLQLPAPTLLRAASHKIDTVAAMRETYSEEPPIYSFPTSTRAQSSPPDRPPQ